MYTYAENITLAGFQTKEKEVLLTKNYDEGYYEIEILILVDDGQKYLIRGKKIFEIRERKISAALQSDKLNPREIILLMLVLILNITLMYNRKKYY